MKATLLKATKAFVLLVAFYMLMGLVAYIMPQHAVQRHVWQTLNSGDLQEDYPKAIVRYNNETQDQYTMDNFTDALIINQALNIRSEGIMGILLLPRHDEGVYQYRNLRQLMDGSTEGRNIHYARYWHGSTFLTRIMLTFMSYTGIRYLLYILSTALLLWCLARLWKRAGLAAALALAAALLSVNVFVMQFSLQFVQVLLVALGGIVWMTYRPAGKGGWPLLFFVIGSLTAYLDLITVPTLTLGLPLVAMIALRQEKGLRDGFCSIVAVAACWLVAYGLTWVTKWGLATLLTGEDIFADAVGQGEAWSEGGSSYIGRAIAACFGFLHWKYVAVAVLLLVAAAFVRPRREGWPLVPQYLLAALIPLAYYVVMAHPAQHHAWFNYRALATTVFATLAAAATMVDWTGLRQMLHIKPKH